MMAFYNHGNSVFNLDLFFIQWYDRRMNLVSAAIIIVISKNANYITNMILWDRMNEICVIIGA